MEKLSSVSFQGNKKQKEKKNVKGAVNAMLVGSLASSASMPVNRFAVHNMSKLSKGLSKDQVETVNNGAQNVLENIADLAKKGIKILDFREEKAPKDMPKLLADRKFPLDAIARGENAAFVGSGNSVMKELIKEAGLTENSIILNKDKMSLATFHEMGHAFNHNNSTIWKTVQGSSKVLKLIAPFIALMPAFTKEHKAKEGEELTTKQKITNSLRKASPFLATAAVLPTVAEETMATIRGNKWAKEVFKDTPELAKKVAKSNKWGLVTYVVMAIATGFGAWAAKKVKDNSDAKKETIAYSHQG